MRRGVLLFSVCCATVLLFLVHSVWPLIGLLIYDGRDAAITKAELSNYNQPQLIPKIIHQTYKNHSIPAIWQSAQQSCLETHEDWEYKFWTDDSSEEFIALEYPWFLETFLNYEYDIQRADAIRYFALLHYGGVYVDLDDGCNRALDPLLAYPAWIRKTNPTGISNDVMGAVPGHPFFVQVTDSLQDYDSPWLLPYVTVMSSTGPLFLSLIWRRWNAKGLNVGDGPDGSRIRVLFPDEYMNGPSSFFTHHTGSSWHSYDVQLMFWMYGHWRIITAFCFVLGFASIFLAWLVYDRMFVRASERVTRRSSASLRHIPVWLKSKPGFEHKLMHRYDV